MADLNTSFNPDEVEPGQNNLDPVPANTYVSQIVTSDVQPPKSGNGLMLKLEWEICEGPFEKRKFWQNINYQHASAQAQMIGQQQLKAICDAIGITGHITDSEVLHYQPVRVRLAIEQDKEGKYAPKNVVKGVQPLNATPPAEKPAATQTSAPKPSAGNGAAAKPASAGGGASRPWGGGKAASPR